MKNQSAFWREVLDYIPQLLLLFRVDEQENTHLIFANRMISSYLGYTAKEYVLESEKQSTISRELKKVIDEIARRSHDVDDIKPQPCVLSSKGGQNYKFQIDFRLFSTSSRKSNLILVLLQKIEDAPENIFNQESGKKTENSLEKETRKIVRPVIASPIIKAAVDRAQQLFESSQNILLLGEQAVGKKTLAEEILKRTDSSTKATVIPRKDLLNNDIYKGASKYIVFYIPGIDHLTNKEQDKLSEQVAKSEVSTLNVVCIATSNTSLEEAVNNGEFDAELYYKLAFSNILIPPLNRRKEDIKAVARQYISDAKKTLHLPDLTLEDKEHEKLMHHKWTKNFDELYEVLFESLCRAQNGKVEFKLAIRKQSDLFPEENIESEDILTFDEMKRRYLARILEITSGKIYGDDGAASLIDLKPTTLQSKLKKLGLR